MTERFDKAAKNWDEEPRRVKLVEDVASAIRKSVPISKDWRALDIGCGTGLLTLNLADSVASVTGADSSLAMLDKLAEKIAVAGISNVKSRYLNLEESLKFEEKFDLIVSSMTLHHIKEPQKLFASLLPTLKSGGYIAFADLEEEDGTFHDDPSGVHHNGFSRSKLQELLESAGFITIKIVEATSITKGEREFPVLLATAKAP